MNKDVLQNFTIEELKAEIKRRSELAKAEKSKMPRCRNCQHLITIEDRYGIKFYKCAARTFVQKGCEHNYIVTPSGKCDKHSMKT